jgi:hypothetical protein
LSFAQERLWFLAQLEPDNPFYNTPLALRLSGPLRKGALQAAFDGLVTRHEVLRTAFVNDGGLPRQVVLARLHVPLAEIDVSDLVTDGREAALLASAQAEAVKPFRDLSRPPLLRTTLVRLAPHEHALLLTMHHIVMDGWSLNVLLREIAHLYNADGEAGVQNLPPLPIQYADFAAWQRKWLASGALDRQLAYWRQQLAGAPPVLSLPTDYARPAGHPAVPRQRHPLPCGAGDYGCPAPTLAHARLDVVHDAVGCIRDSAVPVQRPRRHRHRLANCQSPARGARAACRVLRQHACTADRSLRQAFVCNVARPRAAYCA